MREKAPGLPELNKSQYDAVEKALNNKFTLIQGPPGKLLNSTTRVHEAVIWPFAMFTGIKTTPVS